MGSKDGVSPGVVLGALGVASAIRPVARRGGLAMANFFAGWAPSEMPVPLAAGQAVRIARMLGDGSHRHARGRFEVGLRLATLGGLAYLHLQERRSVAVLDAALAGLADDPVDDVDLLSSGYGKPRERLRRLLLPGIGDMTCRRVTDVSYGSAGAHNTLDIWQHGERVGAPVLVQVHGGGWAAGNKRGQAVPLMAHMARAGWLVVSINYGLSPRSTWPDHVVDVKRALAWVKTNIADFGGDPQMVAITGGSAGGHLAALAALSANDPTLQPGFEEVDTSVMAAVPFYGVYDMTPEGMGDPHTTRFLERMVFKSRASDDPGLWRDASPICRVGDDAPAFFVIHGANDTVVPVAQARRFVEVLRERSPAPVAYAELPAAQHAFDVLDTTRTAHTVRAVHRFLEQVRRDRRPQLQPL